MIPTARSAVMEIPYYQNTVISHSVVSIEAMTLTHKLVAMVMLPTSLMASVVVPNPMTQRQTHVVWINMVQQVCFCYYEGQSKKLWPFYHIKLIF